MKAVILVGGEAVRLQPLTCNTPKSMVPVVNIPFMEYVVRYLSSHGAKEIILTQRCSLPSMEKHFSDGRRFGVKLIYLVEETPLGTAGAVKNAEEHLNETFLVLNGDIFTDIDITTMVALHRNKEAKATIALTPVEDPTRYGVIETDDAGRVTRFLEKPDWSEVTTNMINGGIYVLEPEVLTHVPPKTNFSFERGLFPLLLEKGEPVYAYPSSTYWLDIGTPDKYFQLNFDLLDGKHTGHSIGKARTGRQTVIHPTARIEGQVVIGDNCVIEEGVRLIGPVIIGAGCRVSPGAVIEESIIWDRVEIGDGARVKKSIVASCCSLEAGCAMEASLLGDNVVIASACQLTPASKIPPGTRIDA